MAGMTVRALRLALFEIWDQDAFVEIVTDKPDERWELDEVRLASDGTVIIYATTGGDGT